MAFKTNGNETAVLNNESCLKDFNESLQECLKNIINEEGYLNYTIEKKTIPPAGNFLSSLYEVDIEGKTADGRKVTHLFIKKMIILEKITLTTPYAVFSKESLIYNEVSKHFYKLQDAAKVPEKDRFRFLKSYHSYSEAIVMENASKKGFNTYVRTDVMPIKFAELSMIQLAKFHALSYVTKKKNPRYFDEQITTIRNDFQLNSDWESFIHKVCDVSAQVVKGDTASKVRNYAPRMIEKYKTRVIDFVPQNGCLCHGDYKILNILVREENGVASEILPIDYQLIYYGSPVDDILFFIYTGTDRDFRIKYLDYLKDLYFTSFTKFLSYFNLDVDSTYSRREFEKDYKERLELGLVFGLYMSVFTFAHLEEGFNLSKLSLSELPIIPDALFEERVNGIILDYVEWGYL